MLTDTALKNLKGKEKSYKVQDRDGMYALIKPSGHVVFKFDYRLHGRRESVTLGKYGRDGISLAEAREACMAARKAVSQGTSPAHEKQRDKRRLLNATRFGEFSDRWFEGGRMAESTKAMRRSIYQRDIAPIWRNRLMTEILPEDIRALCARLKERGAPSTAVLARDIVKQIYAFAKLHGEQIDNPADAVAPASIATIEVRDRALSPSEIGVAFQLLERIATLPTIRLGLKLILLTMVRKSELQDATWDEVHFEHAVWSIPKERMKRSKPHNVYLCRQSMDILIALKTCSGNSPYLLPSRYEADQPMSRATFNRVTTAIADLAAKEGHALAPFTVHDLRRTGSTLLNEAGFNSDWVEKCLAHESKRSSRGVYNKAEYEPQRRHMLQEWANMVDAWVTGDKYMPALMPPTIYSEPVPLS